MSTRGALISVLSGMVGDQLTTGSPAYLQGSGYKYSQVNYNQAIDFAVELLKEMFMTPVNVTVTWPYNTNASVFEATLTTSSIVYVTEVIKNTASGGSLFEVPVPFDIITVTRDGNNPYLHFDHESVVRKGWTGTGTLLVKGYKYPTKPTSDSSELSINDVAVLQAARLFLFQTTPSRDPSEMLKGMRQLEQSRQLLDEYVYGISKIPESGGIWLDA